MQAIVELALECPLKLRMLEVPRMHLKQVGVNGNGAMLQLDRHLHAIAFWCRAELEQRVLV